MADIRDNRVAVYIDFDNIVISRYDEVHGKGRFTRDRVREYLRDGHDDQVAARLKEAAVDVGAMVDFASSFGTLVLTRAYADWSQPVNAEYRGQLVGRAVDLVQLFPAAAYGKNGADIRLAVDAIEDMFRLPDLTHLVIVAGDSDYIALAQRAKRLGRYVVAVGVAGSTSRSLAAACDRMVSYDALPGIAAIETIDDAPDATAEAAAPPTTPRKRASRSRTAKTTTPEAPAAPENVAQENPVAESPAVVTTPAKKEAAAKAAPGKVAKLTDQQTQLRAGAGQLLQRALRLGHDNDEDAEWLESSTVKRQLLRMDPAFSEKELGYATFSDFANSFKFVELDDTHETRRLRLRRR
jgi:NYN domain/OST-HTH/LOTUS domain